MFFFLGSHGGLKVDFFGRRLICFGKITVGSGEVWVQILPTQLLRMKKGVASHETMDLGTFFWAAFPAFPGGFMDFIMFQVGLSIRFLTFQFQQPLRSIQIDLRAGPAGRAGFRAWDRCWGHSP